MEIAVANKAKKAVILGHGIRIPERRMLVEGVHLDPAVPALDEAELKARCGDDLRKIVVVKAMHEMATFSVEVEDVEGGKALANKVWNRLWDFHLLSLAGKSPCIMLYMRSFGVGPYYAVVNRNLLVNPFEATPELTLEQLQWAADKEAVFKSLIPDQRFGAAMRYYGNSHYLLDLDARIMLLWAGIEGLLNADAELSRRIALYAAVLHAGSTEEKLEHFHFVRKAYGLRSRVVHGNKPTPEKLKEGYEAASSILAGLLGRCVELGRVPKPEEFDAATVAGNL